MDVYLFDLGVRFLVGGEVTAGRFALVEHTLPPRGLGAPLHRHANEDECSFVVEGRLGAQLGDETVEAGAGEFVWKPRGQEHTFWNAGDEPCRILEIIAPAGFEEFFRELSDLGGVLNISPETLELLNAKYGLEMQPETVPGLVQRFGLRLGEQLAGGWRP